MNFPPISSLCGFLDTFRHDGDGRLRFTLGRQIATIDRRTRVRMYWNGRATTFESSSELHWKKGKGGLIINPLAEPNPHILIVGMSGFGKSTLLKSMLLELGRTGTPAVIFDAHSEHEAAVRAAGGTVYDARRDSVNIFELCGLSVAERTSELVGMFKELYSLGYIQAMKLSECIWYTYRKKGARSRSSTFVEALPTISDLLLELDVFIRNARYVAERNTLLHLKERISLLNTSSFGGKSIDFKSLGKSMCTFSLAGLKSRDAQAVYIGELLRRLYLSMKDNSRERGLGCYVVIDEAQFLIDGERDGIIRKIFEEGRKYGVGAIIATHAASTLSRKIIANTSVFVTFYAREPAEVSYVSSLMSGNDQRTKDLIRNRVATLGVNTALVIANSPRQVSVVRTKSIREFEDSTVAPDTPQKDSAVEEGRALEIARAPILRATLCMEVDENVVDAMISSGTLDSMASDVGDVWVMKHNPSLSIEHEVMVKKISDVVSETGVRNWINRTGRGPDLVLYHKGGKIAVEYETGRKSLSETEAMLLTRKRAYRMTIVVVNDNAYQSYKRLEKSGFTVLKGSAIGGIANMLATFP